MANSNSTKAAVDQNRASYADDAIARRVLQVDGSGNIVSPSGLIDVEFDYIALTYVAAGNGAGEIETATYKTGGSGGTTVATVTITYDASDRIATVTKS
jgi:hypothetical protein